MKVAQIKGKVQEGVNITPRDLNLVVNKLNEVIKELNSISYRQQDLDRKINRNTHHRIKESRRK